MRKEGNPKILFIIKAKTGPYCHVQPIRSNNKTPKGIMRSAVPLPCLFDVVKSQNVAGQRPRQGTKSCRMGRNSVRPSVRTSIRPSIRPPLAGPQTLLAGPQTLLAGPQTLLPKKREKMKKEKKKERMCGFVRKRKPLMLQARAYS